MQKERCMGGPNYTKYFLHNNFIIMKKKPSVSDFFRGS